VTLDEAKRLAEIAGRAGLSEDGPAPVAVENVTDELNDAFPAYRWTATGRVIHDEEGFPCRIEVTVSPR